MNRDSPQSLMAIKTDSASVKDYIKNLFSKVEGKEEDFIINLSTPLQRNPLEVLMHLQGTQYELDSDEQLPYQPSVLTIDVYLDIERARKNEEEDQLQDKQRTARIEHEKHKIDHPELNQQIKQKEDSDEDDSDDSDNRSEFTKEQELKVKLFNLKCEWENIHNKVIFDAVNEALDGLRPYGLKGPPLTWSKQQRTLTYKNGDTEQIPKILDQVEKKVVSWTNTYAGTLSTSELAHQYNIPYLDDNQLSQIREERLAYLLAAEIEENEPNWIDYEFEETHSKLDLANMILEDLFTETAEILNKINQ